MGKFWKNISAYLAVALVSIGATYATYNYLDNRNNGSVDLYDTFAGQGSGGKLHLASLTGEGYPDFTKVAESSTHAVVNIKSVVKQEARRGGQQRMVDPFEYFFGFGDGQGQGYSPQQQQPSVGYGSGVLISNDGYIITNNHVIDKASEIEVTLNDNQKFQA